MEKTTRYSKKREAILNAIRSTNTHPSANWIYQALKPAYPDLSLGTVYRNLARFQQEGLVVCVGTVRDQERFDAMVTPHPHFICRQCGAVLDFPALELAEDPARFAEQYGMKIDRFELTFYGTCPNCIKKEEEEEYLYWRK